MALTPVAGYPNLGKAFQDAPVAAPATRANPTLRNEFVDEANLDHYKVIVSADSGHTLDGTGTMACWGWDLALNAPVRYPTFDFPITPAGFAWSNVRAVGSQEFDVNVRFGGFLWCPVGVGADAGNITTTIEGSDAKFK